MEDSKGRLVWKTLTAEQALSDDMAAWYISFNPTNCYYQLRNVATGNYITYAATGTNGIRTTTKEVAGANENFHIMRSRIDVEVGSGDTQMNVRGYWLIHPEHKQNPSCLVAIANGAVSTASFTLSNTATVQRWLLLSADEVKAFEIASVGSRIDELEFTPSEDTSIYSITGVRVRPDAADLNALPAGVYIIRGRKVTMK